eukprot:9486190-Pyramimonas_sp.AAC.1
MPFSDIVVGGVRLQLAWSRAGGSRSQVSIGAIPWKICRARLLPPNGSPRMKHAGCWPNSRIGNYVGRYRTSGCMLPSSDGPVAIGPGCGASQGDPFA